MIKALPEQEKKVSGDITRIKDQEDTGSIQPEGKKDIDNFFTAKKASGDVSEFVKEMKAPREKIEQPPGFDLEDPKLEETDQEDPGKGETDKEMEQHLDFDSGHKMTAEFILIQMDKAFAFGCSMISGQGSDSYRKRKEKIQGEDYELDLGAALIKKYQMRLSLEAMFISAMVMSYAPIVNQAIKDGKSKKKDLPKEDLRKADLKKIK